VCVCVYNIYIRNKKFISGVVIIIS